MREILFRGKNDKGEWAKGYYVETLRYNNLHWIWDGKEHIKIIPETVGQYTGLTDKNGTKIFEGDIVRYMLKIGIIKEVCGTLVCYWLKSYISNDGRYEYLPYFPHNDLQLKVIGNIHDNPELLKGE